jgi:DNA-binding response OmpR family regulator
MMVGAILVVEDEPLILLDVEMGLQEAGFEMVTAPMGRRQLRPSTRSRTSSKVSLQIFGWALGNQAGT